MQQLFYFKCFAMFLDFLEREALPVEFGSILVV